jgi:hypothetical protein
MVRTDCSPQLESAILAAWAREGMITSRIEYGNLVLICLLHYDKLIADDPDDPAKQVLAAKTVHAKLECRVGVLLKECTSHVFRAPRNWIHQHKGTEFSKSSKDRFYSLLSASFASILKDNRISEAIVRVSVILAVLETKRFETPSFSDTTAIDAFVGSESKKLHVYSTETVKSCNDQHLLLHEPIVERAKSLLKHSCVYLSAVCTDDTTGATMGTLHCSVVYGHEIVDGDLTGMVEGGFNVGVKLPHNGDKGIKNPLYSQTVATYLRTIWLKKISFWSRGIVDLAEKAKDMAIDPTNQLIEAIFKNVKHGQDVFQHVGDPGQYVLHRMDDCRKSEKRFIDEFQYLGESLKKIQDRRSKKKRKKTQMSQDAATQEAEEKIDEPWSRKGASVEAETKLRNRLLFISTELFGSTNNSKCHDFIKETHVGDAKNMMSYPTFNNFMNGKSKPPLNARFMKGLQAFVSRNTETLASATATVTDQVD